MFQRTGPSTVPWKTVAPPPIVPLPVQALTVKVFELLPPVSLATCKLASVSVPSRRGNRAAMAPRRAGVLTKSCRLLVPNPCDDYDDDDDADADDDDDDDDDD